MQTIQGKAPAQTGLARPKLLVVDNGGTITRLAAGAETLEPRKFKTPRNYERAIDLMAARATRMLGGKPDAIGMAIAGKPVDGKLVEGGVLRKNGWIGKPLAQDVGAALGLEAHNVVILNDCVAAANSERVKRPGTSGMLAALSTGYGGSLWFPEAIEGTEEVAEVKGDEPGHEYLRLGGTCGCGRVGCMEAFISGSGFKNNYKVAGENIPADDRLWEVIRSDAVESFHLTLERYRNDLGATPESISFIGSVATSPAGRIMETLRTELPRVGFHNPVIQLAVNGEDSGMYGALYAAQDRALAA